MDRIARDDLLVRIRADRAAFDAIVDRVPADLLQEPMLPGGWSVKDVLAHNDPDRFTGLPEGIPGWRPWRVLDDPDHYADHGHAIALALAAKAQE